MNILKIDGNELWLDDVSYIYIWSDFTDSLSFELYVYDHCESSFSTLEDAYKYYLKVVE